MKFISQKIAYIRGMAEGLELDTSSKEGKIIEQMIDVLGDMSDALGGIVEAHEELREYVDVIDDDLNELEDVIVSEEFYDFDDEEYIDEEDDCYEVICPNCKRFYITGFEAFESDTVTCPECGEPFHLEEKVLEELTHGEGCQCGHHHE